MNIKNEYTVTYNLLKSWMWESKLKGIRLFFFISWICFGVILLPFGILGCYYNVLYGYFILVMVLFCFYCAFLRDILALKRQYSHFAKIYGKENWARTILFDDNFITVTDETSLSRFKYGDITDIIEKEERVSIIIKKATTIRVYKDCFVDSDWETCKIFILSKQDFQRNN